eukprot:3552110-Rhodomonas_salina.1
MEILAAPGSARDSTEVKSKTKASEIIDGVAENLIGLPPLMSAVLPFMEALSVFMEALLLFVLAPPPLFVALLTLDVRLFVAGMRQARSLRSSPPSWVPPDPTAKSNAVDRNRRTDPSDLYQQRRLLVFDFAEYGVIATRCPWEGAAGTNAGNTCTSREQLVLTRGIFVPGESDYTKELAPAFARAIHARYGHRAGSETDTERETERQRDRETERQRDAKSSARQCGHTARSTARNGEKRTGVSSVLRVSPQRERERVKLASERERERLDRDS